MSRSQVSAGRSRSAFGEQGLKDVLQALAEEIRSIYLADAFPWVVGYSGGKDSTAVLQLIWTALRELPAAQRSKPIHVISTDTLVENPVVASWVTQSLETMRSAADQQGMPITPHRLVPETHDSFWVNLIGRGYPAPRPKFRWCTERLKIRPSNAFINKIARESGEAILVLGTRKAESSKRAHVMGALERKRIRDHLSPNANLPNSLVYSPIENWSNDDVWLYLMQVKNPWGYNNKDLLTMYQGASPDGECPLVVDSSTPSCGDSRFGCWVCTLVEKDKSMSAMIQNDEEKAWMLPLLELRNELDVQDDSHLRDFRRLSGNLMLFHDDLVRGPYTQSARAHWLRRVLEAQRVVRENGPAHVSNLELISQRELTEIRRIWVVDKHEIEDELPRIYQEAMGQPYPGPALDDNRSFGAEEMKLLFELCERDDLHYQLTRNLLDVSRRFRTMVRRSGLYEELEDTLRKGAYTDEHEATARARRKHDAKEAAKQHKYEQLSLLSEDTSKRRKRRASRARGQT